MIRKEPGRTELLTETRTTVGRLLRGNQRKKTKGAAVEKPINNQTGVHLFDYTINHFHYHCSKMWDPRLPLITRLVMQRPSKFAQATFRCLLPRWAASPLITKKSFFVRLFYWHLTFDLLKFRTDFTKKNFKYFSL